MWPSQHTTEARRVGHSQVLRVLTITVYANWERVGGWDEDEEAGMSLRTGLVTGFNWIDVAWPVVAVDRPSK